LCSTIGLWFTAGRQSLTRQKWIVGCVPIKFFSQKQIMGYFFNLCKMKLDVD
jgi:hypothetical protein